jgi:hypothetical protein
MLITSTKAMTLITLSLVRSFVAGLIARCPFAVVAARSPLLFRLYPRPAVSQSVQVHALSLVAVR